MNKKEEKLKSSCAESDRKARVEKVASLLKTVPYKTESDRLESTTSFARSSLTEGEIETVIKPLKPEYLESKNAQIYKKGLY